MKSEDIAGDGLQMSLEFEAAVVKELKRLNKVPAAPGLVLVFEDNKDNKAFVLHSSRMDYRIVDLSVKQLAVGAVTAYAEGEVVKYIYPGATAKYCGVWGGVPQWRP